MRRMAEAPADVALERHRCEVRWCIRMGADAFQAWFKGRGDAPSVAKARGSREAAERLLRDVKQQARLGNTGQPGEWKEPPP